MHSIKQLKQSIENAKTIAIIGHENPDADSLASTISIKRMIYPFLYLDDKCVDLFCDCNIIDEIYEPIIKDELFLVDPNFESYDLAICVDCPISSRMGQFENVFKKAKQTVLIDHHETPENFADNNFLYKCSSTCELIYILFKALSYEPTLDVLKLIYAGIITDTVNLTQGTVKVSSYKIVAEIAEKINDMDCLNSIKDHFLKNKSKSNLKLLEIALRSMMFYLNDKLAIMKITGEDLKNAEATQADTLGIVNNAINIKGVYIAVLFIKQEDGSYYASIRGKNGVDVSSIAYALGGGGHETVAAFTCNKLSEIKETLLNLCKETLLNTSDSDDVLNLFDE